jgi:hypothetical protein
LGPIRQHLAFEPDHFEIFLRFVHARNVSNPKPEFTELLQSFGITAGIVHGIMGVFGHAILFPFRRLGHVFDLSGIKIADSSSGEAEWITPEETVEVVIDELPVERNVIATKRPTAWHSM